MQHRTMQRSTAVVSTPATVSLAAIHQCGTAMLVCVHHMLLLTWQCRRPLAHSL
jgi:hypothetical protein